MVALSNDAGDGSRAGLKRLAGCALQALFRQTPAEERDAIRSCLDERRIGTGAICTALHCGGDVRDLPLLRKALTADDADVRVLAAQAILRITRDARR
jgi:hypothetical protein